MNLPAFIGNNAPNTKDTIIQLLSNLANPKEIKQYLKRFVDAEKNQFAIVKIGGALLESDLKNLCSSLAFLQQIGLFPVLVHGAGPQLSENLKKASIESQFINGQRVTSPQVLSIAKKTFIQQNMKLASQLKLMGVNATSITTGVFSASPTTEENLGLVGDVTQIDLGPIDAAIADGAIPILSPLAESATGQSLNINADTATNHLAITLQPYKIIFLTSTGGLLDADNNIISTINLVTDYNELIQQPWLQGGMKLKIKQIAEILSQLPSTASVSITKPANLAKELFTHKGSGTLVRKGESIRTHTDIETIKQKKLTTLIEAGFGKPLVADYYHDYPIYKAYITYCYRAAAIFHTEHEIPFLDKFVVAEDAKGEGLGKAIWSSLSQEIPKFFWRTRPGNPINQFYFSHADGYQKDNNWFVFWVGLTNFQEIEQCVSAARTRPATLQEIT